MDQNPLPYLLFQFGNLACFRSKDIRLLFLAWLAVESTGFPDCPREQSRIHFRLIAFVFALVGCCCRFRVMYFVTIVLYLVVWAVVFILYRRGGLRYCFFR